MIWSRMICQPCLDSLCNYDGVFPNPEMAIERIFQLQFPFPLPYILATSRTTRLNGEILRSKKIDLKKIKTDVCFIEFSPLTFPPSSC